MNEEQLLEYVEKRWNDNIREFHIVGGHNNEVPFDYYLDTIRVLKKIIQTLQLKPIQEQKLNSSPEFPAYP